MVEQESRWTDHERDRMLALAEYESRCCSGCGTHESITDHPEDHVYVPDQTVCPICAGLDIHTRVVAAEDRDEAKALAEQPKHPRKKDGRRLFLRPATPAEREKQRKQRAEKQAKSEPKQSRRRRGGGSRG